MLSVTFQRYQHLSLGTSLCLPVVLPPFLTGLKRVNLSIPCRAGWANQHYRWWPNRLLCDEGGDDVPRRQESVLKLLAALATGVRSRTNTASRTVVLLVPLVQVVVFALTHQHHLSVSRCIRL
ncbi:hypothetical protein [Ktedonospora formicarum]|uniref:hypothetical protein n=1 Tax=Ktedonospora formicarum TaxID=2778364 RepID=UPI001C689772|nr:hypothetical protein [Ktedonospora formicarum]